MDNLPVSIPEIIVGILCLWFIWERGLALMMFFQQEEYDSPRFTKWLFAKKAYDKAASFKFVMAMLVAGIGHLLLPDSDKMPPFGFFILFAWVLIGAGFFHGILLSRRTRQDNKKPLVITQRAKRIFAVFMVISVAILLLLWASSQLAPYGTHYSLKVDMNAESFLDMAGLASLSYDWRPGLLAVLLALYAQALPFILMAANGLLAPMEERVKAGFRSEAVEKFNSLKPTVIAITGSFGKTSTKHILAHILEEAAPTLSTPGSVNTEMGITRVIREKLLPEHQYFIVEMGAYGPGSIARLCKLTPPDTGMITAVGAAHYERFKSLETVAQAKFELAEAVFQKRGQVVVSTDGIDKALLEERMAAVPGKYMQVGTVGDVKLVEFKETAEGLSITLLESEKEENLSIPLYGRHQVDNILLAASSARAIGLPWAAIKGALASMPQIRHRLEVTKTPDGPTILNDAYNSNPIGFASALHSLDALVGEGGRRILITPGMVELGEKHAAEHERLGELAAKHCDIVAVVTPSRIPSFVKGFSANNSGETTLLTFETQQEAENWAKANWRKGDAVLFENNLPDLYETVIKF